MGFYDVEENDIYINVILWQRNCCNCKLGFENEQYNYAYRSADVFMPYIKSNFNPVTDSALNVSLTYMYQDQYGKKHKKTSEDRFKTNRDRIELYLKGYTLNRGIFFSPSAGFRYESWDVNYDNPKKQDKWKLELRFILI